MYKIFIDNSNPNIFNNINSSFHEAHDWSLKYFNTIASNVKVQDFIGTDVEVH